MLPENRYLNKVHLNSDVYAACFQHALTTENEEVMGLLIGQVDESTCISEISACVILHRSDKQPDRVEISPEQLCTASNYAEELAQKLDQPMRVVGWYHSHPHITVIPSHVDVRTQATYQMMDPLFVGLIFSVYQNDTGSTGNHVQLICFQAAKIGSEYQRREIKLQIVNSEIPKYNLENSATLSKILSQEEIQKQRGDSITNSVEDQLAVLHNDAFQTLALVHIVSKVTKPLCESLEARLDSVKLRIEEYRKLIKMRQDDNLMN